MGVVSRVKKAINVKTWVDYDNLAAFGDSIIQTSKRLFIPTKSGKVESFDGAMQRLKLSDQDIAKKEKEFTRIAKFFSVFAFLLTLYSGYFFFGTHLSAALVCIALSLVLLALAFRYHFWAFQIKRRQLGCRLRDWFTYLLRGSS